ncbi:MAG: M48 family metallopeptidase [Oligoflexales bacterium]
MTIDSQFFLADGSKIPGTIEIQETALVLKAEDIVEQWYHTLIKSRIGGAGNKLIFLSIPSTQQISSLYFERSSENLAKLSKLDYSVYKQIYNQDRREKNRFRLSLVAVLACLIFLSSLLILAWNPLFNKLVEKFPYSLEQQIGIQIIDAILPKEKSLKHAEIQQILEQQIRPIIEQMPEGMKDIKIHLSQENQVNAFALLGGHIIFNRGLLLKATSIEEVLGVAAHEIAHIRLRHSIQTLIHSLGLFVVFDILFGDLSGTIAIVIENSNLLLQRGFSRSFELEADQYAYNMLLKSQISPQGMVSFSRRLDQEAMKNDSNRIQDSLSFLSTHPATRERIERLEMLISKENKRIPLIDFDYKKFKTQIPKP